MVVQLPYKHFDTSKLEVRNLGSLLVNMVLRTLFILPTVCPVCLPKVIKVILLRNMNHLIVDPATEADFGRLLLQQSHHASNKNACRGFATGKDGSLVVVPQVVRGSWTPAMRWVDGHHGLSSPEFWLGVTRSVG